MRDKGENQRNVCQSLNDQSDCSDKTTKNDCVPGAKWNDRLAYPLPNGGYEWNFVKGNCRWRAQADDDTIFTLRYAFTTL